MEINVHTRVKALEIMGSELGVSRETMDKLMTYEVQLLKWQRAVNLVSKSSVPDLWTRHFLDSAQLLPHIDNNVKTIVDMGSGGGFPAMVLALTGGFDVHFIESDQKKIEFLRNVSRETKTNVNLHCCRLEHAPDLSADLVTSRALASLDKLLSFAEPFANEKTQCLFLKGATHNEEIACTKQNWHVKFSTYESITDPEGVILKVENFKNAQKSDKNP